MKKNLGQDAIYDARELGVPRMLVLGLQHLFAMFGATVLVPILVTKYGLPLSIRHPAVPPVHQAEGSRLPGLLLRLPGRL